ncbi:hypothetical protein NKF06_20655, partial [Haloferax sp. AB510]|nr:hypothetical protein [Haloferax sp. AB510]
RLHVAHRERVGRHRLDSRPAAFAAAAETARDRNASWHPVSEPLVVRHISWEGTDVTIVSA